MCSCSYDYYEGTQTYNMAYIFVESIFRTVSKTPISLSLTSSIRLMSDDLPDVHCKHSTAASEALAEPDDWVHGCAMTRS